jgi:hypothetical protein
LIYITKTIVYEMSDINIGITNTSMIIPGEMRDFDSNSRYTSAALHQMLNNL